MTLGPLGNFGIVADQDQGRTAPRVNGREKIENLLGILSVQLASRLVGQEQPRIVGQGPRNGYPLLLATRKLMGKRLLPSSKPDFVKERLRSSLAVAHGASRGTKWEFDVLLGSQGR